MRLVVGLGVREPTGADNIRQQLLIIGDVAHCVALPSHSTGEF